uniref:Uncharacterized protein n=1 Tax=Rhizophora mucronata TaxID=61149 RepID=A0A2P2QHP9_RHIMU
MLPIYCCFLSNWDSFDFCLYCVNMH